MNKQQSQLLHQYREFYKKDIFCGPLLEHKGWNVSRYASRCDVDAMPFHMNVDKCLNFPNNYTKLLRENEKDQQYLWEALIKTYPASKLINRFKKWYKENLSEELQNLDFSDISDCTNRGRIIDFIDIPDCYEDKEHPGTLTFYVPATDGWNAESLALSLADFLYVCGYNLANISTIDIPLKKTSVDVIAVTFEAKFSNIGFEFGESLYHVALASSLKKINKHGLTPRSQNNVFRYPERVYLFNNAPLSIITSYAVGKAQDKRQNMFALLRVDAKTLQDSTLYKTGKMRFFIDQKYPNIDNSHPDAIYTYNTIPRQFIDDEFAMYCFDENGILSNHRKMTFNELIRKNTQK